MARIDAHQHFWTLDRDDYGWLSADLKPLYKDFSPSALKPLLAEADISHSIVVQAAPTINETRYLLSLAKQYNSIAGVVGWVPMDNPNISESTLSELCKDPKFVGIRPMLQELDDPAWIKRPNLQATTELLIEYNLCFDALIKSIHLPHLLHFLKQNPTLRCVINHGAKPNIASGEWDSWKTGIAKIAQQTDAFCKISGLITETSDEQDYSVLAPYIDYLVNQFGPERLIWGSDWPVLNLAADYLSWYQAAQGLLNNLNLQEKELVFGLNAQKAYQLKLS
jgi:L-fuconolactonase